MYINNKYLYKKYDAEMEYRSDFVICVGVVVLLLRRAAPTREYDEYQIDQPHDGVR